MIKKILSISNNPLLLTGRNEALAMAGYSVASPRRPAEAPALLASDRFFAVVIGYSVPVEERRTIIREMRQVADVPIIFVAPAGKTRDPEADYNVEIAEAALDLLRVLEDRLAEKRRIG